MTGSVDSYSPETLVAASDLPELVQFQLLTNALLLCLVKARLPSSVKMRFRYGSISCVLGRNSQNLLLGRSTGCRGGQVVPG